MIQIVWDDVYLTYDCLYNGRKYTRNLLYSLSGKVKAGQLLAIMGPTGCGKTSLLNVLSGRTVQNKGFRLYGNILIENDQLSNTLMNNKAVYVAQDALLFSFLTVRETLTLAARFYSAIGANDVDITLRVDAILNELTLTKVADTIIGSYTHRGVSGGEYKRVLIGKELMKSPSVIFLDEPTSGLDSYQAFAVMETMKTLASHGRIVVSVIHQPRSSIFSLFDRLLLLSEGQTMYFGPAKEAVAYFADLGFACPQQFNPADYFLDILSASARTEEAEIEIRERLTRLAGHWRRVCAQPSEGLRAVDSSPRHTQQDTAEPGVHPPLTVAQSWQRWWSEFSCICYRVHVETYRDVSRLVIRVLSTLFFAALLALIYHDLGHSQRNIQDRSGLLFFVLINQSFTSLLDVVSVFPYEKKLVCREVNSGAYRTSSYYVARVICELPIQVALPVIYASIIYWSVGLNPRADRYFTFLLLMVLTSFTSVAMGFCVSALSPSAVIAHAVGSPILIVLLLFSGFYINKASLPVGSEWVVYVSLVYWGFQGLVVNEFAGEAFECPYSEYYAATYCLTTGDEYIETLAFQEAKVSVSVAALLALFVGFTTIGYFGLFFNREKYMIPQPVVVAGNVNTPPENAAGPEEEAKDTELGGDAKFNITETEL